MCGIIGAVTRQNCVPILMDGLRRLEYRGYDSAGIAAIDRGPTIARTRRAGKVAELERALAECPIAGACGIAHTRWATHGPPTEINAHPHMHTQSIAVVHNGIIENHEALRDSQQRDGMEFVSQTDTEVIVNEIWRNLNRNSKGGDLLAAVQAAVAVLEGAYAIGVIYSAAPRRLVGARRGSPLVVGRGDGEAFIASDMAALAGVTRDFFVLEDGDIADMQDGEITIFGADGERASRPPRVCTVRPDAYELGDYRHYMLKEIHEQGAAIANTLEGRIGGARLLEECFGAGAAAIFDATAAVQIIACGSSYHAGLVAAYWFERYGIPCRVETGSEFRARRHAPAPNCLVVALSQSGETIDTLAALRVARAQNFGASLTICNSPESSLAREADLTLLLHAGMEIGVASTKSFTASLCALWLLVIALGRRFKLRETDEANLIHSLRTLPAAVERVIAYAPTIAAQAEQLADRQHALFLGRGAHYPIALEGALKLKEISYIHAEAYPAGELKHGPLALVDGEMPVVASAPNNELLRKLKSNLEEVRARGARLLVFADAAAEITPDEHLQVVALPAANNNMAPILHTIPLQLLAYHTALIKGTDVDKPRNLAKSVTVE